MEFLKENKGFSFLYDGKPFEPLSVKREQKEPENGMRRTIRTYTSGDGLVITQIVEEYPAYNAVKWMLYLENTGTRRTKVISNLYDCDCTFAIGKNPEQMKGYIDKAGTSKVYKMQGSDKSKTDFMVVDESIQPGERKTYACRGGRSSDGLMPFFDINKGDGGILAAIGWTGQWCAVVDREEETIRLRTGLEETSFCLYPGEKIRTSSIVLLEYSSGQTAAHNAFRRLVKEHFSLIGSQGRDAEGPLSAMTWGGLSSSEMLKRIKTFDKARVGYEYYWIDAGWYGDGKFECSSEHTGDWAQHTGNWKINTLYHPDEMAEVANAVEQAGMKLLLWFEPERVIITTPDAQEHPEWFLHRKNPPTEFDRTNLLLNLGNEEAFEHCYKTLSGIIRKLRVKCYRQDFNFPALPYWRENEPGDRRGMLEIKHIMGLYRLWDRLLEEFPDLIIDDCSQGGRRIDIELLSRSIPLWRSDAQCTWDIEPEIGQMHNAGISWYVPYQGTGSGKHVGDTYAARSNYSSAWVAAYWGYADQTLNEEELAWIKEINAEYKRVRPYFSCDYYPLVPASYDFGSWAAWQYDRPERGDGIVLAFRRVNSPCISAVLELNGLRQGASYVLEDADTKETFIVPSEELQKGLEVTLPEKRSSKLLFYRLVNEQREAGGE